MLEHVFPGESEMARRMRDLDWSQTILGPVEDWPQSLRTSVSNCLNCAFPIVIWWGPELAILYNDEYCPFLGPTKHPAALGQRCFEVWAEIWDVIEPMLSQVMEGGEATRSRDLLLHIARVGYPEEAYFSFSYSPIYDESGKVGGVFCPCIETTGKVIGERRLRTLRDLAARCQGAESEAAAYGSAAQVLAANPHDVPFAMLYRIEEGRPVARLAATAGMEPGAAAPETVALEADQEGIWSLSRVARSGEAAVVGDLSSRFDALPTGAWKVPPHSALALPILLPGQELPRAILVAAVSPMRALDEEYRTFFGLVATQIASGLADAQALEEERRRAEALAEIDRAKTAFFSNVSHEFRTPLTLMLGPLEDALASSYGVLPPEAAAALSVAHRNSLRLLRLVNTLLDFSRIEAGRVEASYEPTDLATLTAELASVFRSAIEKAGLRLVVDCPPLPEPAYVDRDMWEKVVLNLLSNALKFTFEGEIAVALRQHGGRIELAVSDTGVGIPEADLPRMFQRFHRVKNARSRTHEGTGIGLALVQELAKLHGGDVSVRSREGEGTAFTVSIPAGRSHLPADRIGAARQLASTSLGATPFIEEALRWLPADEAGNGPQSGVVEEIAGAAPDRGASPARVLVADDNADMRDYLRRLLARSYEVAAAADGQAALDLIRADPPDLVVADVMMPYLDGFGLVAAIRAEERTRTLPVILLSARAGEESRIEGLAAGADDYLIKPFSARELLARVGSQLELARLRKEADRRKDEFLATLAHELRTPLAPIRNSVHILRMAGGDPGTAERVYDMMERQVNHMVRLVDDLMEVSRITRGKIELRREQVDLAAVVRSALETSNPLIEAARHQLTVSLPDEPLILNADLVRLAQVLANLLNNAAKYTPEGGRIWLTARRAGSNAEISIRDTGAGIPAEVLPKVFDLFMQVERTYSRAQGGLGIGLTLVRSLVSMHGGTVEARSDGPGRGSEFVVRLPLAAGRLAPHERDGDGRPAAVAPRRILVVDDNHDAADSLGMLLKFLGADVRTANDGPAALEAFKTYRPSVVLLDIGLPGMDGYEVARQARQQPESEDVTLIALTGWGQEEDRRRSREAGIDHHLIKPVDLGVLERLLANLPAKVERQPAFKE
jgi:signal transduction histidine kinase